jgi:nucleotide-binding universal stress UspA family protein
MRQGNKIMKTKSVNRNSQNGAREAATPRRLLVPVDFSGASLGALDHAARLAVEWGASLRIVHVVARDDGWLGIGREEFRDLDKSLQEQATHELRAIATKLPHGIKAELQVRIGRPAEEIVAAADEAKADLIVLSTQGRTGLDRYLIGSVAERVARLAPCPVYLIRPGKKTATRAKARPAVLRLKREH